MSRFVPNFKLSYFGLQHSSRRPFADDGRLLANRLLRLSKHGSDIKIVRREKPQEVEARSVPNSAEGNGAEGSSTASKRASSIKGRCAKRRIPTPKWLVFTSWWHVSSYNSKHRKPTIPSLCFSTTRNVATIAPNVWKFGKSLKLFHDHHGWSCHSSSHA